MTINKFMEKLKEIQDKGYGESEIIFNYQYKKEKINEYDEVGYYKPLEFTNCIDEQIELMQDMNKISFGLKDIVKDK